MWSWVTYGFPRGVGGRGGIYGVLYACFERVQSARMTGLSFFNEASLGVWSWLWATLPRCYWRQWAAGVGGLFVGLVTSGNGAVQAADRTPVTVTDNR